MGMPVVVVAAGGLPVGESAFGGIPVTEAINGRGIPVTKVVGGGGGLAVVFVTEAGVVVPPVTYATLDPATVTAVTLTTGNLVATSTGTTSADQGAHVAFTAGKSSGKYYFELAYNAISGKLGNNVGAGIGTTSSTYTALGGSATSGVLLYSSSNIWSNNVNVGTLNGGVPFPFGSYYFLVAVDLDNRKIWFRSYPSGNWNGNASYNPATNVGGITIPAGTMVPFCTFGGTNGTSGVAWGTTFGTSGFSGAVPSGFTAGWPA